MMNMLATQCSNPAATKAVIGKTIARILSPVVLMGTIGNGLFTALQAEQYREAALITFLVAVSGVTIAGIGSAFWGVVAGSLALFVQHYGKR